MEDLVVYAPFKYPYGTFHEWERDSRLVREVQNRDIDVEEPTQDYRAKCELLHDFGYNMLRTGPGGNFRSIDECHDLQVGTAFHHVYEQARKRLDRDAVIMDAVFEGIRKGRQHVVAKENPQPGAQLCLC